VSALDGDDRGKICRTAVLSPVTAQQGCDRGQISDAAERRYHLGS
jgi:hypothetical protein